MGVESLVEIVRGLGLREPEVPVGDELVPRQVSQVEVFLAQELVPDFGHDSPPESSKGRTPSARETTTRWASSKERPSNWRCTSGQSLAHASAAVWYRARRSSLIRMSTRRSRSRASSKTPRPSSSGAAKR